MDGWDMREGEVYKRMGVYKDRGDEEIVKKREEH